MENALKNEEMGQNEPFLPAKMMFYKQYKIIHIPSDEEYDNVN